MTLRNLLMKYHNLGEEGVAPAERVIELEESFWPRDREEHILKNKSSQSLSVPS